MSSFSLKIENLEQPINFILEKDFIRVKTEYNDFTYEAKLELISQIYSSTELDQEYFAEFKNYILDEVIYLTKRLIKTPYALTITEEIIELVVTKTKYVPEINIKLNREVVNDVVLLNKENQRLKRELTELKKYIDDKLSLVYGAMLPHVIEFCFDITNSFKDINLEFNWCAMDWIKDPKNNIEKILRAIPEMTDSLYFKISQADKFLHKIQHLESIGYRPTFYLILSIMLYNNYLFRGNDSLFIASGSCINQTQNILSYFCSGGQRYFNKHSYPASMLAKLVFKYEEDSSDNYTVEFSAKNDNEFSREPIMCSVPWSGNMHYMTRYNYNVEYQN